MSAITSSKNGPSAAARPTAPGLFIFARVAHPIKNAVSTSTATRNIFMLVHPFNDWLFVHTGLTASLSARPLQIGPTTGRTRCSVVETPGYIQWEEDGVLGWPPISENIIRIDSGSRTVAFLPAMPEEASGWTKFRVRPGPTLCLEPIGDQGPKPVLVIDTGSDGGAALAPNRWREWKRAHSNEPTTLDAFFMPGAGLMVKEQGWAKDLGLGPLLLTDVPVREANVAEISLGATQFAASLGLAALARLGFIVDGKQGVAYLRPKMTPPRPFEHNRLGAAFIPRDSQSDDLVATVVASGPAAEAGIRNGDVLLKLDELDVTNWQRDPAVMPLSRFWAQPPGTRLKLTLKRGKETLQVTAMLRQILQRGTNVSPSQLPTTK